MAHPELADEIAAAFAATGDVASRRWAALEATSPHDTLVNVASAVMSRPVWELPDIGPVGMVSGSGGVSLRLPNVSTLGALVASCAPGARVVKPGSFSSRSRVTGPAGLAKRLGLPTATDAAQLGRMLERDQFAILPTDGLYAWLHAPETFTVPFLCEAIEMASFQPCTAHWKVNGVVDPTPAIHTARARNAVGQRTLVVHGTTDVSGLVIDDVSTAGLTEFLLIDRAVRSWAVEPEAFGARQVMANDLTVPELMKPEHVFLSIVDGTSSRAWIDLVAASSAATLLHAGAALDLADGFAMARELLGSGAVLAKLRRLQARAADESSLSAQA